MRIIYLVFAIILMAPVFSFSQDIKGVDEIAPFSEGLAAVRKGNQWGFINKEGNLVIDFRDDLVWNENPDTAASDITSVRYPSFNNERCLVQKLEDQIPIYGFIDKKGDLVIEHQFLNVTPYNDGYTTGIAYEKVFKGNNEFKLKIYEYKYHDVLMDTSGKIVEFFNRRDGIQLTIRRYVRPSLGTKLIADGLIAVKTKGIGWEIRKLEL